MVKVADELLDAIADEYIKKGNKAMTFMQYLTFKLEILSKGVAYYE